MRHRFHSICPYFAMFPESFVEHWIRRLVPKNTAVLDPFCGRGTTPFQALLMGRRAYACDTNPVAYCVTRAKTNAPSARALTVRIKQLQGAFRRNEVKAELKALPPFFDLAFHKDTLSQILHLRQNLRWLESNVDCMLAAIILGSLHGESHKSSNYLSNRMPRTISSKPAYSIRFWQERKLMPTFRDVFSILNRMVQFRYASPVPKRSAQVFWSDMRYLPRLLRGVGTPIRYVITSPPYLDVTNFAEDQWLRLWFLGHDPKPTYGKISPDDRHSSEKKYWEMIGDFWLSLGNILEDEGQVVMRIGAKGKPEAEITSRLLEATIRSGRRVQLAGHPAMSSIERRQTGAFRPGSKGCLYEFDYHFLVS